MTAAPTALAWEFWARHRIGLAAMAMLVASFAIYGAVVPMTELFASISSIWFVMGLFYVVGVFAYGFEGRLESAESGFPARMYVLPVRTWLLVAWPMIQGMATAVLLWTLWDRLVLRPTGIETPAWWSAILAAIVAVSQALVWLPFGLPWLRLLVIAATLIVLVQAPAVLGLISDVFVDPSRQNSSLTIFALMLIPVSFLVAWNGVSRARHGDSPDWMRVFRPFAWNTTHHRERVPFRSAWQAQTWYEWRRAGRGLVISVGLMIALVMAWGEFVEQTDDARTRLTINFLLLPLIIGSYWGLRVGSTGDPGRGASLSAFAATRPLSNTMLVAAKLRAAARSALYVWLLVLLLAAIWLNYTGGLTDFGWMHLLFLALGTTKTVAFCVIVSIAFPLLYWRCLVANLWIGLLGRPWVAAAMSIVMSSAVLQGMYFAVQWNSEPARFASIRDMLPWLAGIAIGLKLLVGAGSLRILVRRHQLTSAMALRIVVAWSAVAAVLIGSLAWLVPPEIVEVGYLASAVVLLLPFARLAMAPLALGLNRHR